jgi:hypothetical protein
MSYLTRAVEHPLTTSLVVTLVLLVVGAFGGWLLAKLSGTASLTIEAESESVTIENSCAGDREVDLLLPRGKIQTVILAGEAETASAPLVLEHPALLRLQGIYRIHVRRRTEGALRITVSPTDSNAPTWTAKLVCADDCESKLGTPYQLSYESQDAATIDDNFAIIPVTGRMMIGQQVRQSHGITSGAPPEAHFPLQQGSIRIRVPAWHASHERIDLAQHELDFGDVVDTLQHEHQHESPCRWPQVDGFVRPRKNGGALQVIAQLDDNYVTLHRATRIRIGASAIDKILHQPLVSLGWQVTLLFFGLVGLIYVPFQFLIFYRQLPARGSQQ